jgi:predicted  nucleic acid-binding Zn-ribbon protein
MPDNITSIDAARRRSKASSQEMYDLLLRLDELEELLEVMDERGITTREELVAMIASLEAEAARRDSSTDS